MDMYNKTLGIGRYNLIGINVHIYYFNNIITVTLKCIFTRIMIVQSISSMHTFYDMEIHISFRTATLRFSDVTGVCRQITNIRKDIKYALQCRKADELGFLFNYYLP